MNDDFVTVEELTPESRGQWVVTTQGSEHLWDFESQTYTRHSRDGLNALDFDDTPLVLDPEMVAVWPRVGSVFRLIVPLTTDGQWVHAKYRTSSLITEIRKAVRP